ncbi:hypothetical protein ACPC54_40775 [Kitasatospora sp. NPDC094028]
MGGARPDLAGAVFANPMDTLLAYLRDPSPQLWARRANALVSGLTAHPAIALVGSSTRRGQLVAALRTALGEAPGQAQDDDGQVGLVHVLRTTDSHGLALALAVRDADQDPPAWTVLACLDDDPSALTSEEHKLRWRAWLYWSNLLQFLPYAGGDGVQLASSRVADYPLDTLAVCGGVGELMSLTAAEHPTPDAEPPTAQAPDTVAETSSSFEEQVTALLRDRAWDTNFLPHIDAQEETDLLTLATRIADRGKKAPSVFGFELGASLWPADFVWQGDGVKVAVVPSPPDGLPDAEAEAERRDAAYRAEGWTVRTAADWLNHLDSLIAMLPDAPAAGATPDVEGSLR